MPGPLPKPDAERQRVNKPTIPTTSLPAAGFRGEVPECPVELGEHGSAWWVWAWRTPQAAAWSTGDLYFIGHRAQLEDDIRALDAEDFNILDEVISLPEDDAAAILGGLINRLKALATGKASLLTRVNDMDDKLGLSPKGMAALRWKIVEEDKPQQRAPKGRELKLVEKPA